MWRWPHVRPGSSGRAASAAAPRSRDALPPLTPILPMTILVPSARRKRCRVFLLPPLLVRIRLFFFLVVLLDFPGSLLVQERPIRPIWATHARTSSKWGGSSVQPMSSNIAAILGKAAEFKIEIPPFPTDDAFPTDLPGIPMHGSALASVENLISWNCELRNSWRDYASAHIAHNALLAQVEISKQQIADNDERRRLAWAAWCYLQGCALVANPPDSPSPERSRVRGRARERLVPGRPTSPLFSSSKDPSIAEMDQRRRRKTRTVRKVRLATRMGMMTMAVPVPEAGVRWNCLECFVG